MRLTRSGETWGVSPGDFWLWYGVLYHMVPGGWCQPMISDVLSDAISQIKRYKQDMPDTYFHVARDIDGLVEIMSSVRKWLDTPEPIGRMLNADVLRQVADGLDNPAMSPVLGSPKGKS